MISKEWYWAGYPVDVRADIQADVLAPKLQAGSRVCRKHVRAFMPTLAKSGEVWRTLANPQRHIHESLPDIHQSSGEGSPHSPEFR